MEFPLKHLFDYNNLFEFAQNSICENNYYPNLQQQPNCCKLQLNHAEIHNTAAPSIKPINPALSSMPKYSVDRKRQIWFHWPRNLSTFTSTFLKLNIAKFVCQFVNVNNYVNILIRAYEGMRQMPPLSAPFPLVYIRVIRWNQFVNHYHWEREREGGRLKPFSPHHFHINVNKFTGVTRSNIDWIAIPDLVPHLHFMQSVLLLCIWR